MKSQLTFKGTKTQFIDVLQLALGALITMVTFNLFLAPSQIAPGGVTGLAVVLHELFGFTEGLTILLLNIPPILLGYYYLGRRHFFFRTAFVVIIFTLGIDLSAPFFPAEGISTDPLLVSIFGGIIGGIGTGLVFRSGGTVAGTSIISRILQLRTGLPISQLYVLIDGTIILLEAFILGWDKALYAVIMLFVWGFATDYVLEGPSVVRTATIVTNHPVEVSKAVMQSLGIGVTSWRGQGMYTHEERSILFCTVSRPDVNQLQQQVIMADREAFIVIGQAHQRKGGVVKSPLDSHRQQAQKD